MAHREQGGVNRDPVPGASIAAAEKVNKTFLGRLATRLRGAAEIPAHMLETLALSAMTLLVAITDSILARPFSATHAILEEITKALKKLDAGVTRVTTGQPPKK